MEKRKKDFFGIFFETGIYRVGILIVMCVVMSFISRDFFKVSNFLNIFRQSSVLLVLAACATGCILTHGIDNSIGGVMSLCGCACGYFLNHHVSIPVAIILTILIGMSFGCINGFLVGVVKIPPFVSTYGVSYIANGLALILMGSDIFSGFPKEFRMLASGNVLGFPLITIIALGVTFLMYQLFQRSKFGKQVYCVGGEGSVFGAVIGALILTLIVNAMNLLGVPALAQSIVTGAIIVLAVLLDVQMKKIQAARAEATA